MTELSKQVAENEKLETAQRYADDEIDLVELLRTLWAGKLIIILVTLFFAVVTAGITLMLPNQYKASVILSGGLYFFSYIFF
ncbi:MAG: hypothetical protein EOO68_20915, partial [Moraxellaceae bacterium]